MMKQNPIAALSLCLLTFLVAPGICRAQPLADHIPADAMLYIGWNGADSPGPGYDTSHLKKIIDASDMAAFFNNLTPAVVARVNEQNPMAGSMVKTAPDLTGLFFRRPAAIYIAPLDPAAPPNSLPNMAFICDIGNDTSGLASKLNLLLVPVGLPWRCRERGSLVIVSNFDLPAEVPSPLSADSAFQSAMQGAVPSPMFAVYVNGMTLWPTLDRAVTQYAPPQFQQIWPHIMEPTGLTGMTHYAETSGFENGDWTSIVNIQAPAPRGGFLAGGEPLSDDFLRLIPSDATRAGAGSFDPAALYGFISNIVDLATDDGGAQFHAIETQVNQTLGFNVQHDLLGGFGKQWAVYISPSIAGDEPLSFVILNRPPDANKLAGYLTQTESVLTSLAFALKPYHVTLGFRTFQADGATIHYLATPLITPSWAVNNGVVYFGLYPQVVEAALAGSPDGKSLLDNPQYQALRKNLGGPAQITSFQFADVSHNFPEGYGALMAASRLYLGVGDILGVPTPPMVLPPLRKITPELEPAGCISWADDQGLHFKSISPFPGAAAFGQSSVALIAMGQSFQSIAILLPSLNRARETANRVKDANNLKQIGLACFLYANENRGKYPPDLGTVATKEDLALTVFLNPSSGTVPPPPNMTPDQITQWVAANSDYIYLGAKMNNASPADMVLAYDKDTHNGDGMNVLFADGHVDFDTVAAAQAMIDKTKAALGL